MKPVIYSKKTSSNFLSFSKELKNYEANFLSSLVTKPTKRFLMQMIFVILVTSWSTN